MSIELQYPVGHILTPEEAREVPLSRNPIKRLGQLAAYGAPLIAGSVRMGGNPLPDFLTRRDLIRHADARAHAEKVVKYLMEIQENSDGAE